MINKYPLNTFTGETKKEIEQLLKAEREAGRQEVVKDLLDKFDKIEMEQFRNYGSAGVDILHDILIKILKKYEKQR